MVVENAVYADASVAEVAVENAAIVVVHDAQAFNFAVFLVGIEDFPQRILAASVRMFVLHEQVLTVARNLAKLKETSYGSAYKIILKIRTYRNSDE